jgi:3-hydroxyacyl-[acyl-carrier-protein] dehydratase
MIDILKIMETLPHRYPFLLVDRVEEIKENSIVAIKNVTMNEPHFMGHFPGNPVMPGVLMIEALAQVGGIYAVETSGLDASNVQIFFMSIDNVKFRRPVTPGDQLMMEVTLLNKKRDIYKMQGVAKVDGKVACEVTLMAMVKKLK